MEYDSFTEYGFQSVYTSATAKSMPLFRFGQNLKVHGGSFYQANLDTQFCVKMAAEINRDSHVSIPTRDFGTPTTADMTHGILKVLEYLAIGGERDLYIGCMGGRGRTGMFMAILAKVWGKRDPIGYVRKHYLKSAVETKAQEQYVRDFKVTWHMRKLVWRIKLAGWAL